MIDIQTQYALTIIRAFANIFLGTLFLALAIQLFHKKFTEFTRLDGLILSLYFFVGLYYIVLAVTIFILHITKQL